MTTDQLRERVARTIDPMAFKPGYVSKRRPHPYTGMQLGKQMVAFARADSVIALLSPSPRGEEGGSYRGVEGAPVSGSGLTPPAGWRLVPEEPTRPMLNAANRAEDSVSSSLRPAKAIWEAMLAAAPPLPTPGPAGTGLDRAGEG